MNKIHLIHGSKGKTSKFRQGTTWRIKNAPLLLSITEKGGDKGVFLSQELGLTLT
jgi:hypothetical protein